MNKTYISDIANALVENHAALMVGAGFSKNAERLSATTKKFLNWNELSDEFYSLIHSNDNSGKEYCSSLRLAQEVETVLGRPKLETILKDAIPDLDYAPSELYKNLMELPWVDVFTTNYDTLLERATDTVTSRRYNVVVSQEDLINSNDAPRIIKLHGSFPSHRPFIITEEDYRTYPFKFAAFVNTVQQSLLENVFCMVGFSCEDPNFIKWIGWIHDNLGKSSSQKIYMISVTHISEARTKLLAEQNIIVLDLEEIYPAVEIPDRLKYFIQELQAVISQKNNQAYWFNIHDISYESKSDINKITKKLSKLNSSYPGWIFLPWKMKGKVRYVLGILEDATLFNLGNNEEQFEYIYQYLKFQDIAGRPLLSQITEIIFKKIADPSFADKANERKLQYIYLQLLRAFRELAQWENYDNCREKIQEELLSYDDKQFLYASDWWKSLYRFDSDGLSEKLDKWSLSKGDLYWPLIKSSMYALIGNFTKAEEILTENLISVRQKLFKSNKKEYLFSIEESCVSLINFIKQRSFTEKEPEKSVNSGDVFWWDENDKYCLWLNTKDKEKSDNKKTSFELSVSYTTHLGSDNEKIFYALEYLRFIEQSGHPLRLGIVTNTKGLEGTLQRLAPYYPHWCFMQMLIAQDDKHFDLFFGRAKLATMTQEEVDETAKEYIRILNVLLENVDPLNYLSSTSVYEQSAGIILHIIARLCYKCSVDILDSVLNITFDICKSKKRISFKGYKKIFNGLFGAYNEEQIRERIDKVLMFPLTIRGVYEYIDPINYLCVSLRKTSLKEDVYDDALYEIKRNINSDDSEEQSAAINRLIQMCQFLEIKETDKKMLFKIIEERNIPSETEMMYFLDSVNKSNIAMNIFESTMLRLKEDAEKTGTFSGGTSKFGKIFSVLKDIDIAAIDYIDTVNIIKNFAYKNYDWLIKHNGFDAENRLSASFFLLTRLTIYKESLSDKEAEAVSDALKVFENYYTSPAIELFRADLLQEVNSTDIMELYERLWLSEEADISLLKDYYLCLTTTKASIDNYRRAIEFFNKALEFSVCRILSDNYKYTLPALNLCHTLLRLNIPKKENIQLLLKVLERLIYTTAIKYDDSEDNAIYKLQCRVSACQIAEILYKNGIADEAITKWKEISEFNDEFTEIRAIEFENQS